MSSQIDHLLSDDVVTSLLSELTDFLEKNNLSSEDCCIVGSVCLSVRELREHGDIDICIAPQYRTGTEDVVDPIELAPNKYEHIGISDETIVYDRAYHDIVGGIKIVRPEIEYSHKQYRQWDKDMEDIKLLDQYREATDDWKEEIVIENYTPSIEHVARRGVHSLRRDGIRETVNHGLELIRRHGPFSRPARSEYKKKPISTPARAVQSYRQDGLKKTIQRGIRLAKNADPTGLLQRYSNPRHKLNLGTLAENELTLQYPVAQFIAEQYDDYEFVRYDILVYLSAIKSHISGKEGGTELYETFAEYTDAPSLDLFNETVDEYLESQRKPTVPIGYSSEIIDAQRTACAFYEESERINVSVGSGGQNRDRYPLQWFTERDFTEEELNVLRTEFSTLLSRTGTLFEVVLWPPVSEYFDEILQSMQEEESVHSCARLTFEQETFGEFVRDLYATQTEVRWDYIEEKIDRIGEEPSEIMSLQIEVPDPRIRERNSHEMKEIKERYRACYNPKIAPDDPNTRRVIHASDDYLHNRETRAVIDRYEDRAVDIEERIAIDESNKYSWRNNSY